MGMDMDVGAHMSQDIAYTANTPNVNLGFPALITTLCREKGVYSDTHVLLSLQPTIDKKFMKKATLTEQSSLFLVNLPLPLHLEPLALGVLHVKLLLHLRLPSRQSCPRCLLNRKICG